MANKVYTNVLTQEEVDQNKINVPAVANDTNPHRSVIYVVVNNTQFGLNYFNDADIPDNEGQRQIGPGTTNKFSYSTFEIVNDANLHGVEGGIGYGFEEFDYSALALGLAFDNPQDGTNSGGAGFYSNTPSVGATVYNTMQNGGSFVTVSPKFDGNTGDDSATYNVTFYFTITLSVGGGDNAIYTVEINQFVEAS